MSNKFYKLVEQTGEEPQPEGFTLGGFAVFDPNHPLRKIMDKTFDSGLPLSMSYDPETGWLCFYPPDSYVSEPRS